MQCKNGSRMNSAISNIFAGAMGQCFSYGVGFIYRTIFISFLGTYYLGMQSLFLNIFMILSILELGIGNTIKFNLYKPLAENNIVKIKAIMVLFSKLYRVVGIFIFFSGIIVFHFLTKVIHFEHWDNDFVIIYFLILLNNIVTYFFSCKSYLLIADQKSYLNYYYTNLFLVGRCITQILILYLTKSYIWILVVQVGFTSITYLVISKRVDKTYLYLTEKSNANLSKKDKTDLFVKIKAMILHNIGSVVVFGTDSLLITIYVGLEQLGIYSNYIFLIGFTKSIVSKFTECISACIGNVIYSESVSKSKQIFDMLTFLNSWIYSFCSILLLLLLNPLIQLWIGKGYLLDESIVLCLVLNFYIGGMRQSVLIFRNALGLYYNDRYKPIFESVINIMASIIFLKKFGLVGVLLGTLISSIATSIWIEPYVLFKSYFRSGGKKYIFNYIRFFSITVFVFYSLYYLKNILICNSITMFITLGMIYIIGINIVFYFIFRNTDEFKFCIEKYRIWANGRYR